MYNVLAEELKTLVWQLSYVQPH